MDALTTHIGMLKTQITQQATLVPRPSGKLSRQPETNSREQCNAIIIRSGKKLEEPYAKEDGLNEKEGDTTEKSI